MDMEEVLKYVDELVFAQTGKHLDSLQMAILKGVFNGQKYAQIAKEYNCTKGHAKDEAYELWSILSKALGEDLNRSNVRAAIERLGIVNRQCQIINNPNQIIGNPIQVGNINFCSNPSQIAEDSEPENLELVRTETNTSVFDDNATIVEAARQSAKLEAVSRLRKFGLTAEQIAQVLDLPLDEVQQVMS
jgi:DNA-directed RNA polymerase specialized sigma24 family protein